MFLELSKGPKGIVGPKRIFPSFWRLEIGRWINQILAIEASYKYLRFYNIMAFSLIFEFSRIIEL